MNCIPYIYIRTRAREACGPSGRRNTLQMSRLAIIFFLIFHFTFFRRCVGELGQRTPPPTPFCRRADAPRADASRAMSMTHEPSAHRRTGRRAYAPGFARFAGRRAVEPMRHGPSVEACTVRRAKRRRGARASKPQATREPRNGST